MLSKNQKENLDYIEWQLSEIPDQNKLYDAFKRLVKDFPNNAELGEVVRLLFTSNIN